MWLSDRAFAVSSKQNSSREKNQENWKRMKKNKNTWNINQTSHTCTFNRLKNNLKGQPNREKVKKPTILYLKKNARVQLYWGQPPVVKKKTKKKKTHQRLIF